MIRREKIGNVTRAGQDPHYCFIGIRGRNELEGTSRVRVSLRNVPIGLI
jgi:hypothetical protein